jgi:hypothetical protein
MLTYYVGHPEYCSSHNTSLRTYHRGVGELFQAIWQWLIGYLMPFTSKHVADADVLATLLHIFAPYKPLLSEGLCCRKIQVSYEFGQHHGIASARLVSTNWLSQRWCRRGRAHARNDGRIIRSRFWSWAVKFLCWINYF